MKSKNASSKSEASKSLRLSSESDDDENVALASKFKKKVKKLPQNPTIITETQNSGLSKKQKDEQQQQQTSGTSPRKAIILPILGKHHKERMEAAKIVEIQKASSTALKPVKYSFVAVLPDHSNNTSHSRRVNKVFYGHCLSEN